MKIQEMFNKAVRGLKRQGFRQSLVDGECQYHGPDGRKCAWGHVDPKGTRGYEGETVCYLRTANQGVAGTLTLKQLEFTERLQEAHDRGDDPETMKTALRVLAKKHHLTGAPK